MSKAIELLEQINTLTPFTEDEVVQAFTAKLDELGVENVIVSGVEIGFEGDVVVDFADDEGDEVSVLFGHDPEEGPFAMVVSDDDEQVLIDLSPLSPPIISTQIGTYIDLKKLDWMNLSTIKTLLQAGNVGPNEAMDEVVYKKVVRQGKVVRIPVVKRKKRVRLTPKQRRALALARRKAHTVQAKRKRALSLKIRKQRGLNRR